MTLSAGGPAEPTIGGVRHDVVVTFLDGTELRGAVENFDPQRPTFQVYVAEPREEMGVREVVFHSVKTIAFLRHPAAPKAKVSFAPTARLITVRFLDREMIYGVTESYGGARAGLFLIPTAREEVERIYVPVSAMREVAGKRLGDLLVAQGLATLEMIEQAFQEQQQLRHELSEPVGQILRKKGVLSDHQLAEGLALQRQRPARKIGEILMEQGFIDQLQLHEALDLKERQKDRDKRFGEILVELGYATHRMIAIALAMQSNLPFIDLSNQAMDAELRAVVPAELARQWKIVPVNLQEDILTIAVADPREPAAQDAIRRHTGLTVIAVVASPPDIARTIARYYGP